MSPGAELAAARRRAGLTVEEVADRTRIPRATIELLEADRFAELPAMVYVRGFLRLHARAVGLDPERPIALLDARHAARAAAEVDAQRRADADVRRARWSRARWAVGSAVVLAALIAAVLAALSSIAPHPLEARDLQPPAQTLPRAPHEPR